MDYSTITGLLQNLETSHVVARLRDLNVGELIHDPWFLGITGGLAVLALLMKWRVLLATILSVAGFVGLISHTIQQDTSLGGLTNDTLLIFVVGGVCIVCVVIYLLFIQND